MREPSPSRRPAPAFVVLLLTLSGAGAEAAEGPRITSAKLFDKSLQAARQAVEHYGEWDDAKELRRVADLGYAVAAAADYRDYPFTFFLADMPEPNAFALPGGQIFVTRGMLGLGLDDDMLACLLGHEIAHVVHAHGTRIQRRAALLNALGQALVLGVLVGVDDDSGYDPNAGPDPYGRRTTTGSKGEMIQGAAATSAALSELLLRSYSREFEDQADETGQRLAAAAGYDPAGAQRLWVLMNARVPQSKTYGYWRTHPFSDQRMRSAAARATELKPQERRPNEDFRAATQKVLLDHRDGTLDVAKDDLEKTKLFLEASALTAWPRGEAAETLRLADLHRRRDAELAKAELDRDYGALGRAYDGELAEVRALTPESAFVETLERELAALRAEAEAAYPKAQAVLAGDVVQTPFLETFLSNWPTAPEVPQVALTLADAYARLGRTSDAVSEYLRAAEAGTASEAGQRAQRGLRSLAPRLGELASLQELALESPDEATRSLAHERLVALASSYGELEIGAEYLRRYPDGELAEPVAQRLETLAQNLYGEVILYQGIGDPVKALSRIQRILTHAPASTAAELLRDRLVVDG